MADELADVALEQVDDGGLYDQMRNVDPFSDVKEEDVSTDYGIVRVAMHGDKKLRAMFTFHDLGTHYQTCYRGFFAHPNMRHILDQFCVYHLNAPGHTSSSVSYLDSSTKQREKQAYPTMDQLATVIGTVANHYGVKHFVGLGVGAGANLLSRFCILHPDMVDALILVNGTVNQAGWMEWSWFKLHNWTFNFSDPYRTTVDYLAWHWFGDPSSRSHDLVQTFAHALRAMNRESVSGFVMSYVQRNALNLARSESGSNTAQSARTFTCPTMLITGDSSPHLDAVIETNSRLDPNLNSFLKLADIGGMILDEVPGKMCEALSLFLQGCGFIRPPKPTDLVAR